MPAFASLASLTLAAGRIASLDLCADEYLLLLAPRERIASVSHLAFSPDDSVLSKRAKGIRANRGSLESLLASDAKVLLTTRPLGRFDRKLAARLGMSIIMLESGGPDAVARSVQKVAALSGAQDAARRWQLRLTLLRAQQPHRQTKALWAGVGGVGLAPDGPTAQWLALAGINSIAAEPGLSRVEQVISSDAPLILRSRYDAGHYSRAGDYLEHPLVRNAGRRQLAVDGRAFTCSGPLLLGEIQRLQQAIKR